MLILSQSQAKNYFKKLIPNSNNDDCGCCNNATNYEIKGNRILNIYSGESKGYRFFKVTVIAKIKRLGGN